MVMLVAELTPFSPAVPVTPANAKDHFAKNAGVARGRNLQSPHGIHVRSYAPALPWPRVPLGVEGAAPERVPPARVLGAAAPNKRKLAPRRSYSDASGFGPLPTLIGLLVS